MRILTLRTKLLLSVGLIIFMMMGATTLFHIQALKHDYLEALTWRSKALAHGLTAQIVVEYNAIYSAYSEEQLNAYIHGLLRSLSIHCEQLYESSKEEGVAHVAAIDSSGQIVAHNEKSLSMTPIESSALRDALQQQKLMTVLEGTAYHVLIPIVGAEDAYIGTVDMGIPKSLVDTKVKDILMHSGMILCLFLILSFLAISSLIHVLLTKPIRRLVTLGRKVAKGELVTVLEEKSKSGKVSRREKGRTQDEIGTLILAFHDMMTYLQETAQIATHIASGDLSQEVTPRSQHDELGNAFHNMATHLQNILRELDELVKAVQEGDLSRRSNVESFSGDWRNLVEGLNTVIDLCVEPINMTASHLEQMAQGALPERMTDAYHGDFNIIKHSVNDLIEATYNVTRLAETMAAGDLSIEISERSSDDMLMQALNAMLDKLNGIVLKAKASAGYMASRSQTISSEAERMAEGASQQASAAEEVSSSMEEMVANIRQTAENAKATEKIARTSAKDAKQGGEAVSRTVEAMKEIEEKISIIQEIAMQTNILSMNATIEAAKAQDYGKGFAVVASEVRSLARRSREAAEGIEQLVKSCVIISEQAGEILQRLVPNSEETAKLVQEINVASSEQYAGVKHINIAIQQLDQVIQQNAETSGELAGSSEELTSQAEQLQQIVAFFTVKELQSAESQQEDADVMQALRTLMACGADEQALAAALKTMRVDEPKGGAEKEKPEPERKEVRPSRDDDEPEYSGGPELDMSSHHDDSDDRDDEFERF